MNIETINHICTIARRARKIRVRRGYYGDCKVQISYGPWGLIKKTYRLDYLSFDAFRNRVPMRPIAEKMSMRLMPLAA